MCAWHSQQMYGALYSTWWSEECMTWLCLCHVLNHIWLSATPRTVAHQALSMGLSQARILERIAISSSRESFWIIPTSIVSPVLQADSLPSEPPRKPAWLDYRHFKLFFQKDCLSLVHLVVFLWFYIIHSSGLSGFSLWLTFCNMVFILATVRLCFF